MKRFSKTEVIIIGAILFVVGIAAKKVWISFFIGLPMIIISAVSILRNRKETENADKTSAESLEEPYKEPDIKNETVYEEAPADTKSDNNNSVKKEVVLMPKSDAIPPCETKLLIRSAKLRRLHTSLPRYYWTMPRGVSPSKPPSVGTALGSN